MCAHIHCIHARTHTHKHTHTHAHTHTHIHTHTHEGKALTRALGVKRMPKEMSDACHKFSKVSALVYLLFQDTYRGLFRNRCLPVPLLPRRWLCVLLYINVYTYKYIRLLFIILFFLSFLLFIILIIYYSSY
jgi:hypothetical protein